MQITNEPVSAKHNPLYAVFDEAKDLKMPFPNFNKKMRARGFVCKWNAGKHSPNTPDRRCILYASDDCADPEAEYANGIVFDIDTYDILVPCQRAHVEISVLPESLAEYKIFKLYDASSVRLYFYTPNPVGTHSGGPDARCHPGDSGSWRVCSRRCYDGEKSGWDKRADFKEMYADCGIDETKLDKNYIYFCLLCHPYNYVIDCNRKAELIVSEIYDTESGDFVPIENVDVPMSKVTVLEAPEKNVGCVILGSDGRKRVWRDPYYAERDEMLGNWQDRRYSIIEAIKCGDITKFLQLFPEFNEAHEQIKNKINEYCNGNPESYAILFGNDVEVIAKLIELDAKPNEIPQTKKHGHVRGLRSDRRSKDISDRLNPGHGFPNARDVEGYRPKYNNEHKKTTRVNIASFIGAEKHMPNMNVSRQQRRQTKREDD